MKISNTSDYGNISSSPKTTSHPPTGLTTASQTINILVATVAIIGNTLVILVFIQDKKLLRKSYNILILSLALADVLTAVTLITNPALVLGDAFPYPSNPFWGDIFCRVIWSRSFLFQLVVFSAYICLALMTERWYAVIRPLKYSDTFNKKRTLIYILVVWLWSLILCCSTLFEIEYVSSYPPNRPCRWLLLWGKQRALVGIIQVFFKMVLPSSLMLVLFIHMVYKTSKSDVASGESRAKLRGKMTRMIGFACFMLIICFAPSQTNFALAMAGITRLDSKLHHVLSLLVFINSCLNPFIYGMSNQNYRRGYQKIFGSLMCCRKLNSSSNMITPGSCKSRSTEHENAHENGAESCFYMSERDT